MNNFGLILICCIYFPEEVYDVDDDDDEGEIIEDSGDYETLDAVGDEEDDDDGICSFSFIITCLNPMPKSVVSQKNL